MGDSLHDCAFQHTLSPVPTMCDENQRSKRRLIIWVTALQGVLPNELYYKVYTDRAMVVATVCACLFVVTLKSAVIHFESCLPSESLLEKWVIIFTHINPRSAEFRTNKALPASQIASGILFMNCTPLALGTQPWESEKLRSLEGPQTHDFFNGRDQWLGIWRYAGIFPFMFSD